MENRYLGNVFIRISDLMYPIMKLGQVEGVL
jgi:hypothetical protein